MDSDGFTVDLDALGAAHDRVGRLAAELTGSPRDTPDADAFGHRGLAEAVHAFAGQGKRELAELADETEAIRAGLAESAERYRRADEDGADLFRVAGS